MSRSTDELAPQSRLRRTDGRGARHDASLPQQQWHGWASPVGLGLGMLCVGGFFVLLALGLSVLASIG